jgi:hypothetical protein
MILAVSAIILGMVIGVFGFLRYDLGDTTFYIILSFASGAIFTMVLVGISSVGFRISQKSDNVEVAMAGMGKMLMGLMEQSQRQSNQNARMLMAEMQSQIPAKPANPWGDDDGDDFGFNLPKPATRTVEYTNGHR